MKSRLSIKKSMVRNIFKKEEEFSNTCRICDMKFLNPERTKRHMIKAHSKPKREPK